jgi:hypothetical protein
MWLNLYGCQVVRCKPPKGLELYIPIDPVGRQLNSPTLNTNVFKLNKKYET